MKKLNQVIILSLILLLAFNLTALAADKNAVGDNTNKASNMKTKAFTNEDKIKGFKNYADQGSVYYYNMSYNGRAVGIVYDEDTDQPLKNTWIENLELDFKVKSDASGRFEINNLPDGLYTWVVKAPGYKGSTFSSFPVSAGTGASIFRFALSSKRSINSDIKLERMAKVDSEHKDDEVIGSDPAKKDTASAGVSINAVYSDWPTMVNFTVSHNNILYALGMDEYLYFVVASELWEPNSSLYSGITADKLIEGFKAQAVTARTYADYITRMYNKHTGYDVCATTDCQVFNPYFTNQMTVQAVDATTNQMLLVVNNASTYDYNFVEAVFSASCTGATKNNEAVWGGTAKSYLRGVSCPYDLRPTLDSGHNVGLCQDGAVGYAKNGYKYDYIVKHFFTGVSIITCKAQADIGLQVGETTISSGYYWREYVIQIPASGSYTFKTSKYIDTNGPNNDTVIELFNSSRTSLGSNDDGAGERFSLLTQTLSAGTYYLKVSDYNMDNAINYALTVSGDTGVPAATISGVNSTTGKYHSNHVTGMAKKRYSFTPSTTASYNLETLLFNASCDTYLLLYNASGTLLTSNDDTNGLYSKITYSLTAGTKYYIEVTTYGYQQNTNPSIFDCELKITKL